MSDIKNRPVDTMPVANVNVDITVDTAASELVNVEVNDQEVQHRKVRFIPSVVFRWIE